MNDIKKSKHYCPIPFYSIEINSNETVKLCCISSKRYNVNGDFFNFWNNGEINQVRERMLKDEADEQDCGVCYSREENFDFSKRLDEINKYGRNFDKKLVFPAHLQLKVTNICNLKCIMCSPHYSTKWNEDVDKLVLFRNTLTKTKPQVLDNKYLKKLFAMYFQTKTLTPKRIELYGGEPFLAKNFWKIIYNASPIMLRNISFLTNTNGTILTKEHLQCLIKFKHCMINFSVDGIGENFEYVRFPANWEEVEKNIRKINGYTQRFPHKFEMGLYFTFSSFSAIGLSDFIDYCKENKYSYFINIADTEPIQTNYYDEKSKELREKYSEEEINELGLNYSPSSEKIGFSHPAVLPDHIKEKIINDVKDKLNEEDFIKVKNSLLFEADKLRQIQKQFLVYCDLVKQVRGVDFKKLIEKYERS